MKAVRLLTVLAGVLLVTLPAYAMIDKVGSSGALFLKIGMSPRSVAMGEACGALVGDPSCAFSNPAGLAAIDGRHMYISDAEWIADIRLIGGVYAFPVAGGGVMAFSAVGVDYGEMPLVKEIEADVVVEMFSPRDLAVGVSYARRWTERLYVGGSFKYIDQAITDYHSRGYAFDFGTVYYTGFNSLRLAMATNNFGPDMRFDGTYTDKYYIGTAFVQTDKGFGEYDLPLNFRIGLAYDFAVGPDGRLTAALDATHPNDYSERVHIGAEYGWSETFFLRGGYTINAEEMGVSTGCGLNLETSIGTASIDYAFTDFGVFKSVHRFALGFAF